MLMPLWLLLLGVVLPLLLVRSFHIANADYCPEWRTFFDLTIAMPMTRWQKWSAGAFLIVHIIINSWLWYVLGDQLFTYVATGLLCFWLMLVLLDGFTWWLPHLFTHSLWAIILLLSGFGVGLPLIEALVSGIAGYGGLWGLNKFSLWYWQKPGFGGGDLYFSGALASWFGWFQLGNLWLLAAVYSLLLVAVLKLLSDQWKHYVPFGPGLGLGAISLLLADVYGAVAYYND